MADIYTHSRQVTIQCEHTAPIVYNHYPRHTVWLGAAQIAGGVIMLITGVVSLFSGTLIGIAYGSHGMELVVPAIVTGAFGIAAGRSKATCQITTNMIFSIMTTIGSCSVALLMAQAMMLAVQDEWQLNMIQGPPSNRQEGRGPYLVMLAVSLFEAVVSIIQSTIACHFSCFCCKKCCCNYDTTTTEQILINDTQQEQQLLLLGSCAPAGAELQPTAPIVNYEHGQQQQQLPPPYGKLDI